MSARPDTAHPLRDQMRVLSGDLFDLAEAIIAKYPNSRSASLPLLFLVQSVEGYVTEDGMRDVGALLGLTPAEVLAAGSFYTMLKKEPTGEYVVSICRNITCTHMGARRIIAELENHLGISVGETTADGKITLETAECLATCDGGPTGQVNYEDFYNLTATGTTEIVDRLRAGQTVRSLHGEPVRTHKEISREIAVTGTGFTIGGPGEEAKLAGGEAPPVEMAPGFRPKEPGTAVEPGEVATAGARRADPEEAAGGPQRGALRGDEHQPEAQEPVDAKGGSEAGSPGGEGPEETEEGRGGG